MKNSRLLFFLLLLSVQAFSQRGKDLAKVIGAANTIVNEYTHLKADAMAAATSITVHASGLNANARFAGSLAAGDLILIYQAQGAKLLGKTNTGTAPFYLYGDPNDSSWGSVVNYLNCGLYEFQEVTGVPDTNTINISCPLKNSYSDTGLVQVLRVPRYASLTINAAGVMTAQNWNGATGEGGIVAVEVLGNTILNGKIDVSGLGFRGGKLIDNLSTYGGGYYASLCPAGPPDYTGQGEDKGESIGGYEAKYDPMGGHRCKGAPGNGGGGGNAHNAGGGGGSNAGWQTGTGIWDGKGTPDTVGGTGKNYVKAWNLESPNFSKHFSTGGGRGGYSFASNRLNPITNGPANNAWGGDNRYVAGGLGGRPLHDTIGRLFFGGGGGAGDQDNGFGGGGGSGGGLVYVMNYGTITGAGGSILANGNNGTSTTINTFFNNASDGAGGAGGGGAIVINSVGAVSGFTASAKGGTGGNQQVIATTNESEGPGGGGGGGYIAISNGAIVQNVSGGANGTSNSPGVNPAGNTFAPNGATKGAAGLANQPITNYNLITKTDTVCAGSTAVLTATVIGTLPTGATITWYSAATGGVVVGTGSPFTTPVINSQTIYYVGTCPGTFRVADTIRVSPAPTATVSSNTSICSGGSATLTAGGGGTYTWSPATGLSSTNTATTVATPASTQTYTVTVKNAAGCQNSATVTVTVGGGIAATATATNPVLCKGKSTTLNSSGGTTYSWSPATGLSSTVISNPVATPAGNTTYTVTVKDASGCTGTATAAITVNPRPTANAGAAVSECKGSGTALNASGGGTYSWSPATGLSSTTVANPTVTTANSGTYTVTVVDGNGCRDSASVAVTVNNLPTVSAGSPVTICSGTSTTLQATGAVNYTWSPGTGLSSTTVSNPNASPTVTTTYTVTGTDAKGCVNSDSVKVSIGSNLVITVAGNAAICMGTGTTLTASGAATYSWSPGTGLSSTTVANPTANPPGTTTYTVTGTNGSGCTGSKTVTLTVNSLPVANAGSNVAYCVGGSTVLSGSGGGTYSWSPATGLSSTTVSNPTANPNTTTPYTLTVTDGNNCSATSQVTVTVNSKPLVKAGNAVMICNSGSTTLQASGATSYSWAPPGGLSSTTVSNPTANPASTTTYTVTGTDGNGCVNSDTVTVSVGSNLVVSTSSNTKVCKGTSTALSASGAAAYTWSPATGLSSTTVSNPTATPLNTTTYTVTGSNGSGCSGSKTITVTVDTLPVANPGSNTSMCAGSSVNLSGSGGGSYSWSPATGLSSTTTATTTASPTVPTTYTLTVTDANNCVGMASVTVNVNALPAVTATAPAAVCAGSTIVLQAGGALNYSWSPATGLSNPLISNPSLTPVSNATYTVTGTDANGCSKPAVLNLVVHQIPVLTLSSPTTTGCAPYCVTLTGTNSTGTCVTPNFSFGDGSTGTIGNHCYTNAGTYSVQYNCIDANGCSGTVALNNYIHVSPTPEAVFATAGPVIEYSGSKPDSVCVTNTTAGSATFAWYFDNGTTSTMAQPPCIAYADSGTYCITMIAQGVGGCKDTSIQCIHLEKRTDVSYSVPNVFSPNGDGSNDFFYITNAGLKSLVCTIYDRWGRQLYEINSLNGKWDGRTAGGVKLSDGVYYYLLTVQTQAGAVKQEKGFVQLIMN